MRNLIFALIVIGLIGLYLWHFDPSAVKDNLQKKTLGNPTGNAPCICWCYLQSCNALTGQKRMPHLTLNPAQVVVKYAVASDLGDNTILSETIPNEQMQAAMASKKQKLSRKERKAARKDFKRLWKSNPKYTAVLDNLSSNSATVHLTRESKMASEP